MQSLKDPYSVSEPRLQLEQRTNYLCAEYEGTAIIPLLRNFIETSLKQELSDIEGPLPKRVLDLGCGGQPFRGYIEQFNAKYFSMDYFQNKNERVDVVASLEDPGLMGKFGTKAPFDLILCTEVLEHVFNWDIAFANIYELSKPGTHVIITCPFFFRPHEEPHDYWRPTVHALKMASAAHGFKVIQSLTLGNNWDLLATLFGSCYFKLKRPGLFSWITATAFKVLRRIILSRKGGAFLRRNIEMNANSNFYLSNAFILERI